MIRCMGQGVNGGGERSEGALDYLAKQGYDPVYEARCEQGRGREGADKGCPMGEG